MSYCRWSSDGFQCDVYVYEAEGGYMVHVAGKRRLKRVCDIDFSNQQALMDSIAQQHKELDDPENKLLPIGLPYDGETFGADTLTELLEVLTDIKETGYNVPDFVFSDIQGEIDKKIVAAS
jgi:hypothetical protein